MIIQTRYIGPTDTRGARIEARGAGRRASIHYPHELSGADCHRKAAEVLAERVGAALDDDFECARDNGWTFRTRTLRTTKRWTLESGRTLCLDGRPVAYIDRVGDDSKGYAIGAAEADDLAHGIVEALNLAGRA